MTGTKLDTGQSAEHLRPSRPMPTESYWQSNGPMLLLGGVAIAWYAAVRALCDAFSGRAANSPGWVGAAFGVPIALFGAWSVIGGQPQFALGAIFASSVAAMTLVAGLLICTSVVASGPETRAWIWLVPTAAILLLSGFSGRLGIFHAALLLMQGVMVLFVMRNGGGWSAEFEPVGTIEPRRGEGLLLAGTQGTLAVAVMAAASWAAWKGLTDLHGQFSSVPAHALTGLLVAPAMVLPMLGTGMAFARERKANLAVSSLAVLVQINCCLLFPLLLCVTVGKSVYHAAVGKDAVSTGEVVRAKLLALIDPANAMVLPIGVWRIDIVFLLFCALVLLPAGWGRWTVGKLEGSILASLYVVYLLLATLVR